jgi:hypothetical protein
LTGVHTSSTDKAKAATTFDELPDSGYAQQAQLPHPGPLPFSAATLWRMVNSGEFCAPVKLSASITAWRVGDVRGWLASRAGASQV